MMKKSNFFNSDEWLKEEIEKQKNHAEFPIRSSLEEQYLAIDEIQGLEIRKSLADQQTTPLQEFKHLIDCGLYPPPEVLFGVLRCFELYEAASGRLSLDEVFYEPSERSKGNQSKKHSREMEMPIFSFVYDVAVKKAVKNDESIPALNAFAESYLTNNPKIDSVCIADNGDIVGIPANENTDVDSFLRKYRRWKKEIADTKAS